jgi:hypothetical protein
MLFIPIHIAYKTIVYKRITVTLLMIDGGGGGKWPSFGDGWGFQLGGRP